MAQDAPWVVGGDKKQRGRILMHYYKFAVIDNMPEC